MAAVISVRQVEKSYGERAAAVHALTNVSLHAAAGEILVMMGPSGSGKTPSPSIMEVILRPSSGSVPVASQNVTALPERDLPGGRLRHIGSPFQGFNLFPALTAAESMAIALHLRDQRGPSAMRRAQGALAAVGLADKAKALPANLSAGQKQRVAIARLSRKARCSRAWTRTMKLREELARDGVIAAEGRDRAGRALRVMQARLDEVRERAGVVIGRKNIRTDEPTEKVDTKVLETLIELGPDVRLPVGLRVDAFIGRER